LVIGQKKPGQVVQTVTQMVTYIIMNPENKRFPPVSKPVTNIIKVGRFVGGQAPSDDIIMFKSKVISRHHAEVWGVNGEVYIRDTKSQSGTFLNAMRLSEAGKESKPYRLKPGDIVQFGVDYKGAQEGNGIYLILILDNAKCISVTIDIKTKMEDVAITNANNGPKSNGECTLVGANQGEGNTLVAAH
jgi:pSer/pThr/pTyr-binding forkhead associated (FHA) protein